MTGSFISVMGKGKHKPQYEIFATDRSNHVPRTRNLRPLQNQRRQDHSSPLRVRAPITVKNFIELAEGAREWTHPATRNKSTDKLFDGTIFHRVIPDFMIQGGDPTGTGMGGPGYRFGDETKGSPHKFDKPGKLAMANSGPGTNGCQFFITTAPRPGSPATTPSSAKSSRAMSSRKKSPRFPAALKTSPKRPSFWNPS